jgi:hypothetical protein
MIQKPITTANGPTAYHVLFKIESLRPFNLLTLTVDSYADEATFLAGGGLMGRTLLSMPSPSGAGTIVDDVEAWLITEATSPYQGGQIVADKSDTLDAAKERAWVAIKSARSAAESGTFEFDGDIYDIDKLHVTGATLLASLAKSAGAPYSEGWTLADNSVRDLDADQVISLGIALGQRVSAIYDTARQLRTQIDAATTIEAVAAIVWPADLPKPE